MEKNASMEKPDWMDRFYQALVAVYAAYAFYFSNSGFLTSEISSVISLLLFALFSFAFYCLLGSLACWLSKSPIPVSKTAGPWGRPAIVFYLVAFLIAAFILITNWLACYPGNCNTDVYKQWTQAQTGNYSNWHPAIHTLLIKVGIELFGVYPNLLLVQILLLCGAMAYLLLSVALLNNRSAGWLLLLECFLCGSPIIQNTATYLVKDNAFSIMVILLCAFGVRIYTTKGAWLEKWWHVVAFGIAAGLCWMLRHNGFFFVLPMLILMLLVYRAYLKRMLLLIGSTLCMILLIRFPVYQVIGAYDVDNFVAESVGIPMALITDAYVAHPEETDETVNAFLEQFAPLEEWQQNYVWAHYNAVKWSVVDKADFTLDDITTWPEILQLLAKAVRVEPRRSFQLLNDITDIVWGLNGYDECVSLTEVKPNPSGISIERTWKNEWGEAFNGPISQWSALPIARLFTHNIGFPLLLLLVACVVALRRGRKDAFVLTLPIVAYCFGTMLLLCGNDARFFESAMATMLPMAIALLLPWKEQEAIS